MRFVRKKELIRDYFVIILFIACSDAIFWKGVLSAAVTYPLLLVVAYVNFICKKGITINKLSFLYILGCGCLCGINYFVTSCSYIDNSMIGFFFSMFATCLIISAYDFFILEKFLRMLFFL